MVIVKALSSSGPTLVLLISDLFSYESTLTRYIWQKVGLEYGPYSLCHIGSEIILKTREGEEFDMRIWGAGKDSTGFAYLKTHHLNKRRWLAYTFALFRIWSVIDWSVGKISGADWPSSISVLGLFKAVVIEIMYIWWP